MSGVQQRLKLKQTAIDTWSLREHLTLASAVLRSGDQNWVSVSRTMKQAGEPGRPQDWFSQKNCALQYNLLQEKMNIPKPKRGEKVEEGQSPAEIIVKKLSVERMEELQKICEEEKAEILKLEEETELLSSEDITEEQLQKIMKEVEAEEAEEDRKEAEQAAWLASREAKKLEIQQALKSSYCVSKKALLGKGERMSQSEQSGSEMDSAVDSPAVTDSLDSDQLDVEGVAPPAALPATAPLPHHDQPSPTSSSPLLTALLHSPTRTTMQSPPISLFPTSPYKTPVITNQQPAVANLSQKFSSTSTTTVVSLAPLIVSSSAVSTPSVSTKIVSPEVTVKSSISISAVPSSPVTKLSSSKEEMTTTMNAEPTMETMQEDKFEEETEAVNDAVEVMDTNEEVYEQTVQEEIGQIEQVIFKSEDEDMTDTLTDIDELLRDKLGEGDLIPAAEIEEHVVQEVTKPSADGKDSVNVKNDDSPDIEASVEKGNIDIDTKITEGIKDIPLDDKIENIDNNSSEAGGQTPKTQNESETVEIKITEIRTKEEKTEKHEDKLLEHKKIVESKIDVLDTDTVIAEEEISEVMKSNSEDNNVMEEVANSNEDKTSKSEEVEEPSQEPCNVKEDEPEAAISNIDKPIESSQGVDGAESVPCSPPPSVSESVTSTPPVPPTSTTTTPPSATPPTPDEDKDYKIWKKAIILVWGQIAQHKNANLFAGTVSEADAPEYRDIVYRPMDLHSIKKNIESGHIKTTKGLERDLMLMFFNAIMYNSSDHEVYNLTKDMMEDAEKIVKDYKSTKALLKANEPKALRGKSESSNTSRPAGVEGHYRPRGRSVSGTLGDSPVARSGGQEDRKKRERTVSMVDEIGGRGEKKRRKLDQ